VHELVGGRARERSEVMLARGAQADTRMMIWLA